MTEKMVRDACYPVGAIVSEVRGFELLNELSEPGKKAIKEKLEELLGQVVKVSEENPSVASLNLIFEIGTHHHGLE